MWNVVVAISTRRILTSCVIASVIALCTVALSTSAQAERDVSCSVEEASGREGFDALARIARSGETLGPILEEQLRLTNKAQQSRGNEHKPLRDSLTPQDAERFEVLREKSLPIRLSQTIEAARGRDARVVAEMSRTAWQTYKVPIQSNVDSLFMRCTEEEKQTNKCKIIPEDEPGQAIFAMRMLTDPDITLPTAEPNGCDLNYALIWQQIDAQRVSTPLLDAFGAKDWPVLQQLKAKYGSGPDGKVNLDRFAVSDRRVVDTVNARMEVALRSVQLVRDTANIRVFWLASQVKYRSRLEDLQTYGVDEASFGKTLQCPSGDSASHLSRLSAVDESA